MRGRPLNPLISRELRQRARARSTPIVLTLYLAVLAGVLFLMYSSASRMSGGFDALLVSSLGRSTSQTLLFFLLLLVWFLVPGITAGAIAGERERQTLVPLQVTLLGPWALLLGKLGGSLVFLVLLVVAALPLLGVAFLFGGVSPWEIGRGIAMVLVSGVALACLGLACSSLVRRVQGATVLAYFLSLVLLVGVFFAYAFQGLLAEGDFAGRPQGALVLNPVLATASALSTDEGFLEALPSPFTPARALVELREQHVANEEEGLGQDGERLLPFWLKSTLAYAALGALCLLFSARRLRVPSSSDAS